MRDDWQVAWHQDWARFEHFTYWLIGMLLIVQGFWRCDEIGLQDWSGNVPNWFGLLLIPLWGGPLLQFACNLCSSYAILSIKSQSCVLLQSHCISIWWHGDSRLWQDRTVCVGIWVRLAGAMGRKIELWQVATGLQWDCIEPAIPAQSTWLKKIALVFGWLRSDPRVIVELNRDCDLEHLEIALIWSWIVDHLGFWCNPCNPLQFCNLIPILFDCGNSVRLC